jgi:peptide deformylase
MERKIKLTKRVLHKEAKPVVFDKPFQLQKLAVMMMAFMVENKGIGLAAPQIGISKRLFVMFSEDWQNKFKYFFNPSVLESSKETNIDTEGCLSFPGEHLEIERSNWIKIEYYDYLGNKWSDEELSGYTARCYLHELDHLNGITFNDRVSVYDV